MNDPVPMAKWHIAMIMSNLSDIEGLIDGCEEIKTDRKPTSNFLTISLHSFQILTKIPQRR
jgi:hypothetical protein